MRLIILVSITMLAFAANSILNRLALAESEAGAASFAALRLLSGALMLVAIVQMRGQAHWRLTNVAGPLSLLAYVIGFSFAYLSLDAGLGALILFGGVQITMFAGALLRGESVPTMRWVGAGFAFAGLSFLLWPSGTAPVPLLGAGLMLGAALGWGIYSLLGAGAADPLGATARNFLWATPLGLLPAFFMWDGMSPIGALLAVLSGAVTSGLGYALWYRVLPELPASVAAVAQLTVPIIALAGGIVFIGEELTWRFLVAALMVLGGVVLSLYRSKAD
ncbi:DMT family transporter [Lentibacter algarum]|uniref:DMT family transporter n=1 Tax=Lentibacter algarum TaxID=576131 RepID=UPI002492795B|nr:DMT family transporter [Lentibacter algarum]